MRSSGVAEPSVTDATIRPEYEREATSTVRQRRIAMTRSEALLALVERLRRQAARRGDSELAIDLQLACRHLRRYAAQWIAVEAERTRDPGAQRRLAAHAAELLRH